MFALIVMRKKNPSPTGLKHMDAIDLREAIFPFSLLQIINLFKRMKTGETMEILGMDEDILPDLTAILPAGQFELIGTEAMRADSSISRLRLKKISTAYTNQPKEKCHVSIRSEQR
ncbi:MAG: hypothetical protein P8X96_22430 [Desulfobacteraceae bacterium]|jgi:TusA-related sulfurtransferase